MHRHVARDSFRHCFHARGYVTSDRNLTKPQIEELKSGFAQLYTAEDNGVVVLNRGLDFKQSSNTAVEM